MLKDIKYFSFKLMLKHAYHVGMELPKRRESRKQNGMIACNKITTHITHKICIEPRALYIHNELHGIWASALCIIGQAK